MVGRLDEEAGRHTSEENSTVETADLETESLPLDDLSEELVSLL